MHLKFKLKKVNDKSDARRTQLWVLPVEYNSKKKTPLISKHIKSIKIEQENSVYHLSLPLQFAFCNIKPWTSTII